MVSKLLNIANAEVGYVEKASNKNLYSKTGNAGSANYTKYAYEMDDKYIGFYNGRKNGYAWCDVFTDWCFVTAFGAEKAKELLCQPSKSLGAGCKYSRDYYKSKGRLFNSPKAGDQIFFYDSSKSGIAHTGIVYKVTEDRVYTIEGNTSSSSGVVANGGAVCKKDYPLSYERIAGYGRPNYDVLTYVPTVLEWQKAAIADGFEFPKYGGDGQWGAECKSVAKKAVCKRYYIFYKNKNLVKLIQKAVGFEGEDIDGKFGKLTDEAVKDFQERHCLEVDGEVGINTWMAILSL